MRDKRLVRVQEDRMILGVAAGLANYVNIDPVLVRLLFVLLVFSSGGSAAFIYLILAFIMPEADEPSAKANFFDEEEEIIIK